MRPWRNLGQRLENVTMDSLCARHRLSKGVLYHYFSNRDELFLLCVESVFRDLRVYLEQKIAMPTEQSVAKSIRDYFFCREDFFRARRWRENVLKTRCCILQKHLRERIRALRRPLQVRSTRHFCGGQFRFFPCARVWTRLRPFAILKASNPCSGSCWRVTAPTPPRRKRSAFGIWSSTAWPGPKMHSGGRKFTTRHLQIVSGIFKDGSPRQERRWHRPFLFPSSAISLHLFSPARNTGWASVSPRSWPAKSPWYPTCPLRLR